MINYEQLKELGLEDYLIELRNKGYSHGFIEGFREGYKGQVQDTQTEPRLKPLLRKMDFNTLIEECKREGWNVPTEDDLRYQSVDYGFNHFDMVWTSDTVADEVYTEEDRRYNVELGYAFSVGLQKNVIVNKSLIIDCVIWKGHK